MVRPKLWKDLERWGLGVWLDCSSGADSMGYMQLSTNEVEGTVNLLERERHLAPLLLLNPGLMIFGGHL